jgi:hypothetical protein
MLSWLKVGAVMASNAHFSTLILVCFVRVLCRYCTGGIRCEMASAYIRSKGAGFENVFQVSSGSSRSYCYAYLDHKILRKLGPDC